MLEIRPNCECCDRDLTPADEAYICTFECTWCPDCVERFRNRSCPNCGGDLQRRPVRPAATLINNPPSTVRIVSSSCRQQLTSL
ncbi:DUF1272 domain-containing protein [Arthrobacter pityocampae]|uniref:DUF1272 domain-containing protein n=1 Tax=Arthrobacter pityocampae TaxID=547334 RepID=A0A2S5ITI4_9MICC|nr:DUF1272 domain-containing protein [Arthrobacter pityocampae]PPB47883.1 DUF1272 domain-containing protein [Arthrobacter pityocampae]